MILPLLAAATLAAADPAPAVQPLDEAAHAIDAGRLEQARLMVGKAVLAGAQGPAVNRVIADLALAAGNYSDALPLYQALLVANPEDPLLYERAGIAAIRTGDLTQAARLLERATEFPRASWRAWNARGVAADYAGDWDRSDEAYARAKALAPDRAEILNNMGWSLLVRGRWNEALATLEQALSLDTKSARVAANLELARAAVSEELPQRRKGEGEADWAARLNDAGVLARVQGDNKKAVAAFARAIEARTQWYERAANNLALAERAR